MMTQDEEREIKRFCELAESCYSHGTYTYTDFLGLAETDLFFRAAVNFSYLPYTLYGGSEGCERVMVRFGDEDCLGYPPPPFPIACLRILPKDAKFAEALSHRDCLGALMNLGIKRERLGDICCRDGGFYLLCDEKLADYLCEQLTRIRHTAVVATPCPPPDSVMQQLSAERVQVSSPRADAILARAYHLSRGDSADLFPARLVFINGRSCTDGSTTLREGDILTARGYGRLRYAGEDGQSRKGKLNIILEKFV